MHTRSVAERKSDDYIPQLKKLNISICLKGLQRSLEHCFPYFTKSPCF